MTHDKLSLPPFNLQPNPGAGPAEFPSERRRQLPALMVALALTSACAAADSTTDDFVAASTFTSAPAEDETGAETGESGVFETSGEDSESDGGEMEPPAYCGDGKIDPGEACDDGNAIDTDACTSACVVAVCGDGIVAPVLGEACDDGDADDQDGCDQDCQPSAFVQISAGRRHTCALNRVGEVWCWGSNAYGQLGHGVLDNLGDDEGADAWDAVPLGAPASQISAGALHTCALMDDGHTVRCWGSGQDGRLGSGDLMTIGDDEPASDAVAFEFADEVVELDAGRSHSCVLTTEAEVYCWGNGGQGLLGIPGSDTIGDDELGSEALAIDLGGPATGLSVDEHACATVTIADRDQIVCWGASDQGELGLGDPTLITVGDDEHPADIGSVFLGVGVHVEAAIAGVDNSCAIVEQFVRCWGDGWWGVNGNATTNDLGDGELPVTQPAGILSPGEYAVEVDLGERNGCVLLETGRVRCWGEDEHGLMGYAAISEDIGDDEFGHVAEAHIIGEQAAGGEAVALTVGDTHACVLTEAGTVRCWGDNEAGQLGYGDTSMRGDEPGELDTLSDLPLLRP